MEKNMPAGKNGSKKKMTIEGLRELILSGSYGEGDKLPSERELTQMLNVSRNVLREAVISLSAEGMLEVRDRQGIFIKSLQEYGMMDAIQSLNLLPADFIAYQLEVRTIISVPAARLAAQRRTDEDLRKLRDCYDSFVSCPYGTAEEQVQSGKWEALLHHLTTEAAHNPVLSRVNESINTLVEKNNAIIHPRLLHEEGWMLHIQRQHADIISAIEEKNSKMAGEILQLHMIESAQMMSEKYPSFVAKIPSPYWSLQD
ncbi:MAG: FadR/GntR family transcriptional regulator [Synergistaceae bacterium]|nr:FadR/GntR family transcriptional regulator [Synergistaceae bacterium]